jgi:hypothetical protein
VAYVGSDEDLNGATDWNPPAGKALQYRAAFMRANNPVEAGVYGAQGTYPISDGKPDQFSALAGYVQRDPTRGLPGIFLVYQTTKDAYPYAGATGGAVSHGYTLDLYEPIVKDSVVMGVRREFMTDGLGNTTSGANIDVTIRLAKYLRLYTEAGLSGANPGNGVNRIGTPAWRAFVWWSVPIERVRR